MKNQFISSHVILNKKKSDKTYSVSVSNQSRRQDSSDEDRAISESLMSNNSTYKSKSIMCEEDQTGSRMSLQD